MQAARGLQPNERASFAGWRALCPPSGTQGINRELCGIALSIPLFGNRINRFPAILELFSVLLRQETVGEKEGLTMKA